MSIVVEPESLAETLAEFTFAYLVTITAAGTAHVVAVSPTLSGETLHVDDLGRSTRANLAERPLVTLVWPPGGAGGYSLIVDGTGVLEGDAVAVVPTRAVLHRSAPAAAQPADGCAADCVELPVSPGTGRPAPTAAG